MKILAVDTSTKTCSVATADNDAVLAEITLNHVKTHASLLLKMIQSVLDASCLLLDDIDGFAVTIGPGSFTGLRIGLSSVKGLAAATGKPVVGVSSLEALAHGIPYTSDCICPMIDARKGQVYCARFRSRQGFLISETPVRSVKIIHAIEDLNEPCVFVGDGALVYRNMIVEYLGKVALFAHSYQHMIKASVTAQLSLSRFLKGETDPIESLVPVYARKSDAEVSKEHQRRI
jgi:tRNA threonylcarbamoyladenosine biosynthesis protein TsaB